MKTIFFNIEKAPGVPSFLLFQHTGNVKNMEKEGLMFFSCNFKKSTNPKLERFFSFPGIG